MTGNQTLIPRRLLNSTKEHCRTPMTIDEKLEILQRDAASMPVQNRGESTDELRELITGFSGKERHDCACSF